jgi:hypothetical protein
MYVFEILLVPEVMETLRMGMAIMYRLFWLSLHVVVDLGSYRSLNHLHFCVCCTTRFVPVRCYGHLIIYNTIHKEYNKKLYSATLYFSI